MTITEVLKTLATPNMLNLIYMFEWQGVCGLNIAVLSFDPPQI